MAIFGVSGASGATFWGPSRSKLTPLDVFDNVQLCSNRAIGGAYGQKWAFSSKNGRFRSLGPPGATFWGAQRPKQTTLDVLYNVQPCPTHLDLLEVSMAKNGLFGPQLTIRLFTTLHFFGENPFFDPLDQINSPMIYNNGKLCISAFYTYPNIRVF